MPLRLNSWIVSMGGVQDTGGDVLHALGRHCDRPGLISKRGMQLDNAALLAWEKGYFPEHSERPAVNDLLDAIAQDHNGKIPVYSQEDFADVAREREKCLPDRWDTPEPAKDLLARIVAAWRSGDGKRSRLRPLLREAERMVA